MTGRWTYMLRICVMLALLPTNLIFGLVVCKDGLYYDDVMDKCFSCQLICRGDTLHSECPLKCPATYKGLQEDEEKITQGVVTVRPTTTPSPAASQSQTGSSGVNTVVILAMVGFVGVVGVVVSGGFIWYKKTKPRGPRIIGTPYGTPTRSSGNTSLSASRDAELAEPFLAGGTGPGGSMPTLLGSEQTHPMTLDRPASLTNLAPVHYNHRNGRLTLEVGGSVTECGNPVRQPQEHPRSPTGNPFTESQRFRSQSEALFRELIETTV